MAQPAKTHSSINSSSATPHLLLLSEYYSLISQNNKNNRQIFGLKHSFDSLPFKLLVGKDGEYQQMTCIVLPNTMRFLQKT